MHSTIYFVFFTCFLQSFIKVDANFPENCYLLSSSPQANTLPEKQLCKENASIYLVCDNNYNITQNSNLNSKIVSSSGDVENLLDKIDWSISIYSCTKDHSEYCNLNKSQNLNQSCDSCGFTSDRSQVFPIRRSCFGQMGRSSTQIAASVLWFPFLFLGLTCLFGNAVVIKRKILSLLKKSNIYKEKQVYNVLVLNLSCADFIMGVYVILVAIEMKRKTTNPNMYFSDYNLCNTLGVFNLLSSQVSLTTLVIISSYRLHGIVKPYKCVHLKVVYILVLMTWCTWIFISIIPVIESDQLTTLFSIGIRVSKSSSLGSTIIFENAKILFDTINKLAYVDSDLKAITGAIKAYPTANVLVKAVDKFNIDDMNSWNYLGYYSSQYFCSTALIVLSKNLSKNFNLTIVIYDFIVCVFLMFSYLLIWINLSKNRVATTLRLIINRKRFTAQNSCPSSSDTSNKIKNENKKVFRRISLIIATDLIFWLPLCIICFIAWGYFSEFSEFLTFYRNIQIAILCVIPLNSLINPYIYSWYMWKKLFLKCTKKR